MNLLIMNQSPLAIYEQIVNQIKTAIINKEIVPGDGLPSIRSLARDLQISVITTKRAYEELEKEGLIYSVLGKGFYVNEQNTDVLREKKLAMLETHMQELIKECRGAGLDDGDIKDMLALLLDETI